MDFGDVYIYNNLNIPVSHKLTIIIIILSIIINVYTTEIKGKKKILTILIRILTTPREECNLWKDTVFNNVCFFSLNHTLLEVFQKNLTNYVNHNNY